MGRPLPTGMSNGLGRALTLAYNGAKQLTSVSENTGRSVTYAYDGSGNLASVVDALGFTTTFGYTPAGGPAPAGLLSEIFYPSRPGNAFVTNRYDTLGRVATQTNANGAPWSYFFAGYRSEEIDPHGTRHVLYYTRSLVLRAATQLVRLSAAPELRARAYNQLAHAYGWFWFDTLDLREARTLLDAGP